MNNGDKAAFNAVGQVNPDYFVCEPGLSKRELFAAMLPQGILSNEYYPFDGVVVEAVKRADQLIAELEK